MTSAWCLKILTLEMGSGDRTHAKRTHVSYGRLEVKSQLLELLRFVV